MGLLAVSLVCVVLFFLPNERLYKIAASWPPYTCWLMKVILGISIKVRGASYIPSRACVIAANHQTPYDGIIFDSTLPRHSYVAKKSISRIPIFGWLFSLTKPIYIDRHKKKIAMKQIIRIGMARMVSRIFVIIFPEGRRSSNGKLNKYKQGCAVLSWSSRRPVLPIYHNAFNCFTRAGRYKRSGVITVTIGRAIYPRHKTVKEINNILSTWTKHKAIFNRTN